MWVCWSILGLVMIVTSRYLRHYWRVNMWVHAISGFATFVLNIVYGIGAIKFMVWKVVFTVHGVLGTSVSLLMAITCFVGMFTQFYIKNLRWKSRWIIIVAHTHRVS